MSEHKYVTVPDHNPNLVDSKILSDVYDSMLYDYMHKTLPMAEFKYIVRDKLKMRSAFISAHANTKEQELYVSKVEAYQNVKKVVSELTQKSTEDINTVNEAFCAILDLENQIIARNLEKHKQKQLRKQNKKWWQFWI